MDIINILNKGSLNQFINLYTASNITFNHNVTINKSLYSLVEIAIMFNRMDILRYLISMTSAKSHKYKHKYNLLHYACLYGNFKMAKYIYSVDNKLINR